MAKKQQYDIYPEGIDQELEIDDIVRRNKNKYLLVNVIAKRARDLNEGARRAVVIEGLQDPLNVALREAEEKKLRVIRREREKVLVDLVSTT